jgi:hypothetical protein
MTRPQPTWLIWIGAILTFAGCHHGEPRALTSDVPTQTILPVVAADEPVLDLPQMPYTQPAVPPPARNPAFWTQRGLDLGECVTLAAWNSPAARALDARRAALACERQQRRADPSHAKNQASELLETALALQADEIRNNDAGDVAEIFFQLAQAEAQEAIARKSQNELAAALRASHAQVERGLAVQDVDNGLRRQEVELRSKRLKLLEAIDRLSLSLREKLVLAPEEGDWLVRPLIDWRTIPDLPDEESAVSIGLASRPQLRLLRHILHEIDHSSLAVAQQLLATIHPLLGIITPGPSHVGMTVIAIAAGLHGREPEAVSRFRSQVQSALASRERAVAAEIRDAARGVHYHIDSIPVARERYGLRADELSRLQTKAGRGLTPALDLSTARLALFEAESQWIAAIIDLKVQQVRLERAQGLLSGCVPEGSSPAIESAQQ